MHERACESWEMSDVGESMSQPSTRECGYTGLLLVGIVLGIVGLWTIPIGPAWKLLITGGLFVFVGARGIRSES